MLLEITPAKKPEEAGVIYDAAKEGRLVLVSVPYRDGVVTFQVTGLAGATAFVVPCKKREECARVLEALHFELPPELKRAE